MRALPIDTPGGRARLHALNTIFGELVRFDPYRDPNPDESSRPLSMGIDRPRVSFGQVEIRPRHRRSVGLAVGLWLILSSGEGRDVEAGGEHCGQSQAGDPQRYRL
jgi:hypothetical protein